MPHVFLFLQKQSNAIPTLVLIPEPATRMGLDITALVDWDTPEATVKVGFHPIKQIITTNNKPNLNLASRGNMSTVMLLLNEKKRLPFLFIFSGRLSLQPGDFSGVKAGEGEVRISYHVQKSRTNNRISLLFRSTCPSIHNNKTGSRLYLVLF